MTLKVIHRLEAFSNAFVQHCTRFQLTMCSHGSSAIAEPLVTSNVQCVRLAAGRRTQTGDATDQWRDE